jgi:hypothetical protein
MPLFLIINNANKAYKVNNTTALPKKPCTLAVLEPRSFVPQADAMTTAPRHQGILV